MGKFKAKAHIVQSCAVLEWQTTAQHGLVIQFPATRQKPATRRKLLSPGSSSNKLHAKHPRSSDDRGDHPPQ